MDLTTITVDDFKAQFPRDFPYLPVWLAANTPYNKGDRVYQPTDKLFYDASTNGVTVEPPASGWIGATDDRDNYVQDEDIERAFIEAQVNFNQSLFGTDEQITLTYLYLTAHYLVVDLQNATAGLASSGVFPISSKSVGSVSVSYEIPQDFKDDPTFSYYAQTGYGNKYLSLVIPRIIGNVGSVCGGTSA